MSEATRVAKVNRQLLRNEVRHLVMVAVNTEFSRRLDTLRDTKIAALDAITAHAKAHASKRRTTMSESRISHYLEVRRPYCAVMVTVPVPVPKRLLAKYLAIKKQYDASSLARPRQLQTELLISTLVLQAQESKAPLADLERRITKAVTQLFKQPAE